MENVSKNFLNVLKEKSFIYKKIFKISDKFLITQVTDEDGTDLVLKVAISNNQKLLNEINRIEELNLMYPKFSKMMCKILGYDVLDYGYFNGKLVLALENIQGRTFSQIIQDTTSKSDLLMKYKNELFNIYKNYEEETQFDEKYNENSLTHLIEKINLEYQKIEEHSFFSFLKSSIDIVIDDKMHKPLRELLFAISNHKNLLQLNTLPSFITSIGHFNFHGDNLILDKAGFFRFIDPDIAIYNHDPIFSMARFFYSYIHDTGDYDQYHIETNMLQLNEIQTLTFTNKILWPVSINNNYEQIFGKMGNVIQINQFGDPNMLLRLNLNYLFCLLRGVNANYEVEFKLTGTNTNIIKHKSLFLLLNTIKFSSSFLKSLDNY